MASSFRRLLLALARGRRVGRALLVGVVGAAVSACGQQPTMSASSAGVESTSGSQSAPEASASVPAGWEVMEDDTGSLRVALPPDLIRIEGSPGVSAQLATDPPTFAIEVHASAASDLQPPKPWTESTVQAWLLDRLGAWVGGQITQVETSVVELPAGEAIQVRAELHPGGPDVVEGVAYAIPSATGLVDLHILACQSTGRRAGMTWHSSRGFWSWTSRVGSTHRHKGQRSPYPIA